MINARDMFLYRKYKRIIEMKTFCDILPAKRSAGGTNSTLGVEDASQPVSERPSCLESAISDRPAPAPVEPCPRRRQRRGPRCRGVGGTVRARRRCQLGQRLVELDLGYVQPQLGRRALEQRGRRWRLV